MCPSPRLTRDRKRPAAHGRSPRRVRRPGERGARAGLPARGVAAWVSTGGPRGQRGARPRLGPVRAASPDASLPRHWTDGCLILLIDNQPGLSAARKRRSGLHSLLLSHTGCRAVPRRRFRCLLPPPPPPGPLWRVRVVSGRAAGRRERLRGGGAGAPGESRWGALWGGPARRRTAWG